MIKKRAVTAMIWSMAGQIGSTGVSTLFILVFARFLTPTDFGIFATGALIVGLASHLAGLGLSTALVQRQEVDSMTLSTAFWITLGMSCALASGIVLLSFSIALLFGDPKISEIMFPLALGMIVSTATAVLTAVLRRAMNLRAVTIRTLASNLIAGAVATPLAVSGWGAWALVVQAVGAAVLAFGGTLLVVGWPIRPQFDRSRAKELLGFGIPVMKADFLNLFNLESPKFFIGPILGTEMLGVYSMASRLLNLLLLLLGTTASSVAFPLLAEVHRTTPNRVYDVYLRLLRLISSAYTPVFVLASILSAEIITVALGPQWSAADSVASYLCLAGIPLGISYLNGATAMAVGHPELRLRLMLLSAFLGTVLLAAATPLGLVWVGIALLVRSAATELMMTRGVVRLLNGRFPRDVGAVKAAACAGVLLALVGVPVHALVTNSSIIAVVSATVSISIFGYVIGIYIVDPTLFKEARLLFHEQRFRQK